MSDCTNDNAGIAEITIHIKLDANNKTSSVTAKTIIDGEQRYSMTATNVISEDKLDIEDILPAALKPVIEDTRFGS